MIKMVLKENVYDLFTITDVVSRTSINRKGETVKEYEIYFKLKNGKEYSITVNKSLSKEETVQKVRERAKKLDGLLSVEE